MYLYNPWTLNWLDVDADAYASYLILRSHWIWNLTMYIYHCTTYCLYCVYLKAQTNIFLISPALDFILWFLRNWKLCDSDSDSLTPQLGRRLSLGLFLFLYTSYMYISIVTYVIKMWVCDMYKCIISLLRERYILILCRHSWIRSMFRLMHNTQKKISTSKIFTVWWNIFPSLHRIYGSILILIFIVSWVTVNSYTCRYKAKAEIET